MAAGKEIKNQINAIKNTKKITKAMEMVASSKMKKIVDKLLARRAYIEEIFYILNQIALKIEKNNIYLQPKNTQAPPLIIAVSTDRGLCGSLNINLVRELDRFINQLNLDKKIKFATCGKKILNFAINYFKADIVSSVIDLNDDPQTSHIQQLTTIAIDAYEKQEISSVYIAGNSYINTMTQKPFIKKLLPFSVETIEETKKQQFKVNSFYTFEPAAEEMMGNLLARLFEATVLSTVIENKACEQAARMIAMKNASDNASNLIDELLMEFNKARQASITQEISEIIGGANAL